MPNTYTQLHIQIVFAVKHRQSLIEESQREAIEKYICGIISKHKCKPLAIYCNPDHTHLLIGLHPAVAISDIVRAVKASSSKHIKDAHINPFFSWQDGYAAFSYSRKHVGNVVRYILNQHEHHAKQSFKDELINTYKEHDIDYNERYLFDWIE